MPFLLGALSTIGTVAMLWVGGGILIHGLEEFGQDALPHWLHHTAEQVGHASPIAPGVVEWIVGAAGSAVVGLTVGAVVVVVVHQLSRFKRANAS
jgi:predicted DNA repair protein MutK